MTARQTERAVRLAPGEWILRKIADPPTNGFFQEPDVLPLRPTRQNLRWNNLALGVGGVGVSDLPGCWRGQKPC